MKEKDFVFLETARPDAENYLSYLFIRPEKIISTFKIDEIKDCFTELNQALKEGYYTAGFLSYEAGEAFEERLRHKQTYDFPLLWFGVYKQPLIYNHRREKSQKPSPVFGGKPGSYLLKNIRANISRQTYIKAIARIKDLIARGLTYQVNYTFKLKFAFSGSPSALYLDLRNNQHVSYSALIKAGSYSILSISPELFFRKKGRTILARPMKGTARRGKTKEQDCQIAAELKNCRKNCSENLMIVDLLRNDLGRISTTGSVRVRRLFNVERYETLLQMTSDIKSRLKTSDLAFDIFSHIFPSGSVTGAPKIKTMEIIRQLEKEPRNIYTGAVGFFSPENSGVFNVAIRTILIDNKNKAGEMGVGSGIVYDSDAKSEFAECRLKADFLVKRPENFQLIETMLWQPETGYLLLAEHLNRLENSAGYFNFLYQKKDILAALKGLSSRFRQKPYKVRLLLDREGRIKLEPLGLKPAQDQSPKVYCSIKRTDSGNPFLYHKTTNRKSYDHEYKRCKQRGFYDVIFSNEKGQITEGAISNVFIKKNGTLFTPPADCGLLDGVYRRYLLGSKNYIIKEKPLFKKDLKSAEEVYVSNSVRGLVRVHLAEKYR